MNNLMVGRDVVDGLMHPILTNQSGLLLAQVFWDPVSQAVSFNGSSPLLTSAARTATTNSTDQPNYSWRGGVFILDVTAASATPSITLTVQGKDSVSGLYYTILTSAAVTGISTNIYRVYPGLTAVANATANDVLPVTFRVVMTHADADSITYSVGFQGVI